MDWISSREYLTRAIIRRLLQPRDDLKLHEAVAGVLANFPNCLSSKSVGLAKVFATICRHKSKTDKLISIQKCQQFRRSCVLACTLACTWLIPECARICTESGYKFQQICISGQRLCNRGITSDEALILNVSLHAMARWSALNATTKEETPTHAELYYL